MFCSHQKFDVINCSFCPEEMTPWGDKKSNCLVSRMNVTCECIQPYFPSNSVGDPCKSALKVVGLAWVSPLVAIQTIFLLYNLVYSIWIVHRKAIHASQSKGRAKGSGKCNYVIAGAAVIFVKELLRIPGHLIDPYRAFDAVPDRTTLVLSQLSYALFIFALCLVFLSFDKAVQSTQDRSAGDATKKCNWSKLFIIVLTAVGMLCKCSQELVLVVLRATGYGHQEATALFAFDVIDIIVFVSLTVLIIIVACVLKRRLEDFAKTFAPQSRALGVGTGDVLARLHEMVAVLNRYFFPAMGGGMFSLNLFVVFSLCLGELSALSYILSWTVIDIVGCVSTLCLLLSLEGKRVSDFPCRACPCCTAKKHAYAAQLNAASTDSLPAANDSSTHYANMNE